ncbi:V-type proton ATPase subunit F-like [Paramacrobiotus metropolitanus]|uniref:V-type proton ATPase subunit F-like n=1 Tax=Paramacrobiotus metropolitanus TaxID=2943436 RepID=UPI0024457905|nr:V-type proton ATPase subunit F-like [Paramacrobiotus metropolitanus]
MASSSKSADAAATSGTKGGKLIAVIADEDAVVGFVLGGIGELNKQRQPNYFIVNNETLTSDIEEAFKTFTKRDDIGIILISQGIAEKIRYAIDSYRQTIPTVLEIPSKDHPYDPSKDSILRRAKVSSSTDEWK